MAPKRKILFPPTKTVRSKAEIKRAVREVKAAMEAGELDLSAGSSNKSGSKRKSKARGSVRTHGA